MPKRHQKRPRMEMMHGRNNPDKSTVITTGTYKKKETYKEQATKHEDPGKLPQQAKVPPKRVIPPEVTTKEADSRAMMEEGTPRSGSDSNAHTPRKDERLHEGPKRQPKPQPGKAYDFEKDLRPDNFAGANYGLRSEPQDTGLRAIDFKELYDKLADLTKDELRNIVIIPLGERLEQGAKYIDLQHMERGEQQLLQPVQQNETIQHLREELARIQPEQPTGSVNNQNTIYSLGRNVCQIAIYTYLKPLADTVINMYAELVAR